VGALVSGSATPRLAATVTGRARLGLLFPGQGTLRVGIGAAHLRALPRVRAALEAASGHLRFDVLELCATGPEAELISTARAQCVVTAWNLALLECLDLRTDHVAGVAGHSAGELSALVGAGALAPEEALVLSSRRARAMSTHDALGGMLAVNGPTEAELVGLLAQSGTNVVVAVVNEPTRLVVSGSFDELATVHDRLRGHGVRCRALAVGDAYHSPLMSSALPAWRDAVDRAPVRQTATPVVSGPGPVVTSDPEVIRSNLVSSLTACVRWSDAVDALVDLGVTAFVEVGCSHGFRGLVRRRHPSITYRSLEDPAELRRLQPDLAGASR
jgi:[acyl-carrier-protein] S-malonyltransferase